ncbi:MAG: hypothetical protein ACOCX2_01310 [Armatimonadota bacterium]
MTENRSAFANPIARAAVGAIVGGPVGVVTALATGGRLVLLTGLLLIVGAIVGALTAEGEHPREAIVDALLPIGVWLVGAAVAWVILGTFHEDLPGLLQEYPSYAALGAAVLGGTMAVVVLMVRLGARGQ